MGSGEIQARHVFHAPTAGQDRVLAWQESTGEPAFVWGRHSGGSDGFLFGPVKRDFRKWLQATASASLTVYHDGMGADALGPLDACSQKIHCMHTWFPRWERHFDWMLRCTGKVLTAHPAHTGLIREHFGWIPERFIQSIPGPSLQPALGDGTGAGPRRPRTGIWLHGRNWRRYGNRLRSLVDRWPESAGQLEIVAGGKGKPAWARTDKLVWSLGLPTEFALLRLHTWDSTLLLDDFSLDAPWLRFALSLDVFPLIPEGNGHSRTPAWQEDSAPHPYPWGEFDAAIETLSQWRDRKQELLPGYREWIGKLNGEGLKSEAFIKRWQEIKQTIAQQHAPRLRKRRPAPDWYSVAWYERLVRLRAGT